MIEEFTLIKEEKLRCKEFLLKMYLNFMHWFSRNCKPKNIPWLFTIAIDGKNCFAFGNRIFTTSFCLICSLKLYWFNFRPFHAHGHCVNLQRGNQNRIVHTTRIICEVTFFTHENFCLDARAKKLSWVMSMRGNFKVCWCL